MNVIVSWLPSCTYWRVSPSQSYEKPDGNIVRASRFKKGTRLPMYSRRWDRLKGRGIQLIRLCQSVWFACCGNIDNSRQRHEMTTGGFDVVLAKTVRREAIHARRLGNNIIRATPEIKTVDIILTHQYGQRIRNRLHRYPKLICLPTIDMEMDGRIIECEITIDDNEEPAFLRYFFEVLHCRMYGLKATCAANDHLHR